jgi:hypothetical protein
MRTQHHHGRGSLSRAEMMFNRFRGERTGSKNRPILEIGPRRVRRRALLMNPLEQLLLGHHDSGVRQAHRFNTPLSPQHHAPRNPWQSIEQVFALENVPK